MTIDENQDAARDDPADIESLAQAAVSGDRVALDDLLAAVQPQVRRICGRMLPCPEDAEEATQDALMVVATKISTFAGRSRFSTWMYAVTANSARGTYRKLKRRAAERPLHNLPPHADPRTTSVIAGSRLDLLEALEQLGASHPDLVEPLVLRDVQELDYTEIAEVIGVPLGTIKSRIHAARQTVRPLLRVQDETR